MDCIAHSVLGRYYLVDVAVEGPFEVLEAGHEWFGVQWRNAQLLHELLYMSASVFAKIRKHRWKM